jgi:archaellum component FlaC
MKDTNKLLQELIAKIDGMENKVDNLEKSLDSGFKGIYKRLDGIDHELKKLNTVTKYKDKWDNIPA